MEKANTFNDQFDQVSSSRQLVEEIRAKLIQGNVNLNETRKVYHSKQRELAQIELEISNLKKSNGDLKAMLMEVLIEKEEYICRRSALESNIEKLERLIEDNESETELMILNSSI